ncbi:MAG: type II CAAX endopeptidase family protein [Planctomycetota bacterium]|nr:type II CAAX endopeptidase family protein [Planctomycetota bacterium]
MRIRLHPALAFVAGWIVFLAAMAVTAGVTRLTGLEGSFAGGFCLKVVLVALAVVMMGLDRRRLADFGLCLSRSRPFDWLIGLALGGLCGAIGSVLIVLTPAEGMGFVRDQAFWQIIVGVWIVSSIGEEIFVRGLVQTWMTGGEALRLGRVRVSSAVLASGLLFGSMHLLIARHGADVWTVCIIVAFTTSLGLVAAWYRERTGSVLLPIVVHVAGNIGGMIGGAMTMIIRAIVTGETPTPPG